MRYRMTVADDATGLVSDVVVEVEPDHPTGVALDLVADAAQVSGTPTVHGDVLPREVPVARSALRDGAVLHYGAAPSGADPDPYSTPADVAVLRVVAGPSAGTQLTLPLGAHARVGRDPSADVALADRDVSWSHAQLRASAHGIELTDLRSTNGTFVDGRVVVGARVLREGEIVQLGGSRLLVESARTTAAVLARAEDGTHLLNRRFPDRLAPFAPPSVELPRPMPEDEHRGLPLLAMLLPLVLAGALAWVFGSPTYLLIGLLTPVLLGGNWWSDRRRQRRRRDREHGSYAARLEVARARIEDAITEEDAHLRLRWPDPATVARTALSLRRELWSRRPGDDDWLGIRVGVADRPASVRVSGERPADWEEPVLRRAPIGIDLDDLAVLGLAGPPPWLRERIAWVLGQCAVLHSPDELRIAVIAPGADEQAVGWLRWLPHVGGTGGTNATAWDDTATDELLRALVDELERREALLPLHRDEAGDRLLVVLHGAGALVRRPAVAQLLARGPAVGMRFVCADTDDRLLPDRCRAVLVGSADRSELRIDLGERRDVAPDTFPDGVAERIARALAPLRRIGEGSSSAAVPDAVRLTDLVGDLEPDGVARRWARGHTAVTIGRDADGPVTVDLAVDGPHALVAGTTGAGKSELLRSWIAALALASPPRDLSLLFMDYKGGATFKDLLALPHVVGYVTNLDDRLARRATTALRAELERRQQQLSDADAADLAEYRLRAAADPALPPFPRLVIVADEVAEMKKQQADLVDELIAVAQIGRSLGVHLVLATQKPAGVVDGQIDANIDLRLCLRVANDAESLGVIGVADAARIPKNRPGRALLVRGAAAPAVVQTARVTTPQAAAVAVAPRAVLLHWTANPPPPQQAPDADDMRTDLHHLVEVMRAAAGPEGPPFRPWTPPLPTVLELETVAGGEPAIVLGLRDRPAARVQEPLRIPLGTGHVGVIGSGRTGRTSALRAIAVALARSADPGDVHLHVVDAAGGLRALQALPHVGVVADDEDPERLERLLSRLVAEVRRRRRLLADAGAADLTELRTARPDTAPAHIVLLVDGWSGVVEGDGAAQTAMQELLGGGAAAAGVTVVLAGDERLLRYRVLNRLDHRLCLRLNNPSDVTALGLRARDIADDLPPGRGVWGEDGSEVQVPVLTTDPSGTAQSAALAAIAAELRNRYGDLDGALAPLRLDPLPSAIGLADAAALGPARPDSHAVLVGVSGDRLRAVWVRLGRQAGHLLIAGPPRSGRSTAAATVAASAAAGGLPAVLVTARCGPAHAAAERAGVTVIAPADLGAALDLRPAVVVVDDADTANLDEGLIARLTAPDGPALAVAASIDAYGIGARGLVKAALKEAGPVVLLCPSNSHTAAYVNVAIDRNATFTGPPGRAYLLVDGELHLGQVARLQDTSADRGPTQA